MAEPSGQSAVEDLELAQIVPRAVFLEDVRQYVKGAGGRGHAAGVVPGACLRAGVRVCSRHRLTKSTGRARTFRD